MICRWDYRDEININVSVFLRRHSSPANADVVGMLFCLHSKRSTSTTTATAPAQNDDQSFQQTWRNTDTVSWSCLEEKKKKIKIKWKCQILIRINESLFVRLKPPLIRYRKILPERKEKKNIFVRYFSLFHGWLMHKLI